MAHARARRVVVNSSQKVDAQDGRTLVTRTDPCVKRLHAQGVGTGEGGAPLLQHRIHSKDTQYTTCSTRIDGFSRPHVSESHRSLWRELTMRQSRPILLLNHATLGRQRDRLTMAKNLGSCIVFCYADIEITTYYLLVRIGLVVPRGRR